MQPAEEIAMTVHPTKVTFVESTACTVAYKVNEQHNDAIKLQMNW